MQDIPIYPVLYRKKIYKKISTIGIEIELEDPMFPSTPPVPKWKVKGDGSLRGRSGEFVLDPPKPIQTCIEALGELRLWCDIHKLALDFTPRTSVHIHYNMTDKNISDIYKVLMVYFLLEEILVKWSANPKRIGSNFCLRLCDSDTVLMKLLDAKTTRHFKQVIKDNIRYSALNLNSLSRFGSLEFRSMEGNLDVTRISNWMLQIEKLILMACEFKQKEDILEFFEKVGPVQFMQHFLTDVLFKWAITLDQVEDMLYRNHSYCYLLAYHSTSFTPYVIETSPESIKREYDNSRTLGMSPNEQRLYRQSFGTPQPPRIIAPPPFQMAIPTGTVITNTEDLVNIDEDDEDDDYNPDEDEDRGEFP